MVSCSVLLALLAACDTAPASVAAAGCPPASGVSWSGWGEGFFRTWCGSCHSADTPDRRGAPPGVDFDLAADVWRQRDAIRAAVERESMPVGGGLSVEDLELLDEFLTCEPVDADRKADVGVVGTTTVAAIEASGTAALASGYPRAERLWEAYRTLLAVHGQSDCPFGWQFGLGEFQSPLVGCTTAAGWTFAGLTLRKEEVDADGVEEWLTGDASVQEPAGAYGTLAGEVRWWRASGGEPRAFSQSMYGTWGMPWESGWLAESPSLSVSMEGTWSAARVEALLSGGITLGGASVYLDGVTVDTLTCPGAPTSGTLLVRGAAGAWSTITLASDCSGCGAAADPEGVVVGTACVPWASVLASLWEPAP